MKVNVMTYLNVRIGKPSLNAPCHKYLSPGDELTVDGTIYKGDLFEGNDSWMKDEEGNYYWAGGLESTALNIPKAPLVGASAPAAAVNDYNALIPGIPPEIRNTKGKGVTIAIIDTGCVTTHDDLQQQITARYDAYNQNGDVTDVSVNGHGTFIAGILCGNGTIKGIAPQAKLIIIKVLDSLSVNKVAAVKDGLTWLLANYKDEVDVINMSLSFDPFRYEQDFNAIFSAFRPQTIMLAAAGDNEKLYKSAIAYPAAHELVTGIGAVNAQVAAGSGIAAIHPKSRYIYPDADYVSYGKTTGDNRDKGSSYATALTSGIMALLIADYKQKGTVYDRKKLIEDADRIAAKLNAPDLNTTKFNMYTR